MGLYQATALHEDAEIGYGEAYGAADAISECLGSIGDMLWLSEPVIVRIRHGRKIHNLTMAKAAAFAEDNAS